MGAVILVTGSDVYRAEFMIQFYDAETCIGQVEGESAAGLVEATERYVQEWLGGSPGDRDAARVPEFRQGVGMGAQRLSRALRKWTWEPTEGRPLGVWLVVTRPLAHGAGPEE